MLGQQLEPELQAAYLLTLPSIRERCNRVFGLAQKGELEHIIYHPEQEAAAIEYCSNIIKRDFGSNYASIPPHSRWRHFEAGGISRLDPLLKLWDAESPPPEPLERAKRLVDLCLVSVLVDAGAGNQWTYSEKDTGAVIGRSEGLAIASIHAFKGGKFSSNIDQPYRVDAQRLSEITTEFTASLFQVDESNPMDGLEGRSSLLVSLGNALKANPEYFGKEGRPGNMLDFLLTESKPTSNSRKFHISSLFHILVHGLSSIWPGRESFGGVSLGDVWKCNALLLASNPKIPRSVSSPPPAGMKFSPGTKSATNPVAEGEILVPFHKLTQWLTYSLVIPMQDTLGWVVEGMEDMTGLPEYRNGGLFIDLGVLELKQDTIASYYRTTSQGSLPCLPPSHPAIIEWRAMTVILLDRMAAGLRVHLNAPNLTLPQVLESATWKGGREIAREKRPETGGPPIDIESDGTVF